MMVGVVSQVGPPMSNRSLSRRPDNPLPLRQRECVVVVIHRHCSLAGGLEVVVVMVAAVMDRHVGRDANIVADEAVLLLLLLLLL